MTIKKAKVLNEQEFEFLISEIKHGLHPERDTAMLGLSFKCGLRSKEIAGLRWADVTDASGRILIPGRPILLGSHITKGKKPDTKVSMHKFVYDALVAMRRADKAKGEFVIYAPRGGGMTANNVTVYLHNLYRNHGFKGCSSHSGRRTFGTKAARICNLHGGSIVDVQDLLRHSDIRTTRGYVDPSETQVNIAMNV